MQKEKAQAFSFLDIMSYSSDTIVGATTLDVCVSAPEDSFYIVDVFFVPFLHIGQPVPCARLFICALQLCPF